MRGLLSFICSAVLCSSGLCTPTLAEQRVAFVVGIDNYQHVGRLEKARNDAKGMASTLQELGFEVTLHLDAGREQLRDGWATFLSTVKEESEVSVFFAGHGVQIGGLNYLLPRDIDDQSEELLKSRSLSLAQILDELSEKRPRLTFIVIDACRNNPFQRSNGKRSIGGERGLAPIDNTRGTFVMYSAGAGQTALDRLSENDPEANSVYTRRLLPLLREPGFSLLRIAKRVQTEVEEDARTRYNWQGERRRHTQTPAYYDGIVGEYYLAGTGFAVLPTPAAVSTREPQTGSGEKGAPLPADARPNTCETDNPPLNCLWGR